MLLQPVHNLAHRDGRVIPVQFVQIEVVAARMEQSVVQIFRDQIGLYTPIFGVVLLVGGDDWVAGLVDDDDLIPTAGAVQPALQQLLRASADAVIPAAVNDVASGLNIGVHHFVDDILLVGVEPRGTHDQLGKGLLNSIDMNVFHGRFSLSLWVVVYRSISMGQ